MSGALSMPEFGATPRSQNGRPLQTHDRACDEELHAEHKYSVCEDCGCCWGCGDDCCAEWFCPNAECGCSRDMRSQPLAPLTVPLGEQP